jgi:hypothetical protein
MGLANVKPMSQSDDEGDDEVLSDPDAGDGVSGGI